MNGSPSVKVALFIRNGGSESPCRWFYVTGIYNQRFRLFDNRDLRSGKVGVRLTFTWHGHECMEKTQHIIAQNADLRLLLQLPDFFYKCGQRIVHPMQVKPGVLAKQLCDPVD